MSNKKMNITSIEHTLNTECKNLELNQFPNMNLFDHFFFFNLISTALYLTSKLESIKQEFNILKKFYIPKLNV